MIRTMFLWCALIGSLGADEPNKTPAQSSTDLAAYQVARSEAGRDSEAHVRLALWCEAHGLTAERLKHLSLAVLYDPTNALARGLMGLVAYHGKWERPDQVSQASPERPGTQCADTGVPPASRQGARPGRGSVETRPLVRAERFEAASDRPFVSGVAARSLA